MAARLLFYSTVLIKQACSLPFLVFILSLFRYYSWVQIIVHVCLSLFPSLSRFIRWQPQFITVLTRKKEWAMTYSYNEQSFNFFRSVLMLAPKRHCTIGTTQRRSMCSIDLTDFNETLSVCSPKWDMKTLKISTSKTVPFLRYTTYNKGTIR
jgi:hypothetical protein